MCSETILPNHKTECNLFNTSHENVTKYTLPDIKFVWWITFFLIINSTKFNLLYLRYLILLFYLHRFFFCKKEIILFIEWNRWSPCIQKVYKKKHLYTFYRENDENKKSWAEDPLSTIAENRRNKVDTKTGHISTKVHSLLLKHAHSFPTKYTI